MFNFKKVIITGGCGFIGSALIRNLLKNTNVKIFNFDKMGPVSDDQSIEKLLSLNPKYKERYYFFKFNLENFKKLDEIFNEISPDLVFHLAAESHVDRSIDNPLNFLNSNIIGTFNLIEVVRKYLKNQKSTDFRLLHISTDEVFGSLGKSGKFKEETPYDPKSPYSATKASSDHLVRAWRHTYKLPFTVTNCTNNFGPWQFPEKLIPLTILKIINGEKVPIYGNGMQIRDWLFVEDHINALILIATKGIQNRDYCIGGKTEITNLKIVKKIIEIINIKTQNNHNFDELISFVEDRPGHDTRYAIDFERINKELKWSPTYNFDNSLELTVDWYLNNLDWCKKVLINANYNSERLGSTN